jgi:dihydroorotase
MNPPVRDGTHRAGIWRGLEQGIVDVLGSDHAPHTREEKAKAYPATPLGMTGVQTLVPIMLDHVNAGRLSLMRLVDLTSAGPARLFGIARKGRIAAGYDADLTVVDLKRRETITNRWIKSRAGWTPYDGVTVTGWPVATVVRGRRAMWEGELLARGCGEAVRFLDTLASPCRVCRLTSVLLHIRNFARRFCERLSFISTAVCATRPGATSNKSATSELEQRSLGRC